MHLFFTQEAEVMEHYDIIIIGGGPAGSMTGITLQKKGYKTCIIDKSAFPRDKLCGGLLTVKTMELIRDYCPGLDPDDFVVAKTNKVDFYLGQTKVNTFDTVNTYYLTERKVFDLTLIEEYKKNGGILFEKERVKPADIDFNNCTIQTDSKKWSYTYLVGADGCNSMLLRKTGVKRSFNYCIEGEAPRDSDTKEEIKIFFGVARNGYGWYFPKKEYDCVGIGGENAGKTILKQAKQFFHQLGLEADNQKGAPIPSGKHPDMSGLPDNTLVVGDAAGLIDPITGEGIYYALLSGVYAARAIDATIHSQSGSAAVYYSICMKQLRKNSDGALRLQKILYLPFILSWFIKRLRRKPSFGLFYLEKVISTNELNYSNFIRVYLRQRNEWKKLKINKNNSISP